MDDDLNTAGALGELFGLGRELFRYVSAADAAGHAADAGGARRRRGPARRCLDDLCIALPDATRWSPAAAPARRGVGRSPTDGEVCATDVVPLPPAARLADEGRWDDIAELVDERLACGDATYACLLRDHLRAEKDWARPTACATRIEAAGFEVRDTPAGTQVRAQGLMADERLASAWRGRRRPAASVRAA